MAEGAGGEELGDQIIAGLRLIVARVAEKLSPLTTDAVKQGAEAARKRAANRGG